MVPGMSYGMDTVVFEQGARHTFQASIGMDRANPTAMLLCAANMLDHMNLKHYGAGLRKGVEEVINEGKVRTRDMGGYATASEFRDAVIDRVNRLLY